tara:strand:- start:4231 stop:4950 length:720 start_codon:yes stop_codon:yes gene_type:complete
MFAIIHKWHKKFGVFSALFVIFLVISGIALNHSEQLQLNNKFIQMQWLLEVYQINPASEPLSFEADGIRVSQLGERIYFDKREIAKDAQQLIGIVSANNIVTVAFDGQLLLLSKEGETIEHLAGVEGVPAGMREIGTDDQGDIVIKAAHGYYHVNLDALEWKEYDHLDADWSLVSTMPEELNENLLQQYRGSGLTIERVLLDLHSGRIVGPWGVYFVDFIALMLLLLSCTGVWMWWKRS